MKIYYLQNENEEIVEDGFERFNDKCKVMDRENYHIVNGYNSGMRNSLQKKKQSWKPGIRVGSMLRKRVLYLKHQNG